MSIVEIERNGKVGEIILNRPEKLNAFSSELLDGLYNAVKELGADDEISCIIVRANGRAFSAGADLGRGKDEGGSFLDWEDLDLKIHKYSEVYRVPKPVIAVVHGYCMGMSIIVATSSDLTIVAEDTKIGWPALPLGGGILAPISSILIGPKRARELSYIPGNTMSGTEAAALGWANYALPADKILDKARELALEICKTPLGMLRIKKQAISQVQSTQGFEEALARGAGWDALGHSEPGVVYVREKLAEVGLAEGLKRFKAGEL